MNVDEAMEHLVKVITLCQIPKEQWSSEDHQVLRSARQYIQDYRKDSNDKDHPGETDE